MIREDIGTERIQFHTDIDDIDLDVDTLVPLGLIINELITNSLKYAFPEGQSGSLSIRLKQIDNRLSLRIQDNGIGYDPTQVRENSFGSTLITALTDQLEGKMKVDTSDGTEVEIVIPSN